MQLANKHQLAKKDGKRKTESKHACPNAKSIPKRKLEKEREKKKKARPNALRNCNKSKSLSDLFFKVRVLPHFFLCYFSLSQSVFLSYCTGFPFRNVLNIKSLVCVLML